MKKAVIGILSMFLAFPLFASEMVYKTRQDYVKDWYSVAVRQMISHKIPASITLAQGILESSYGNSDLARIGKNHFGIKCHDWTGERMYKDDDKKNECFRKYTSANQSFEDHSLFLTSRSRYANLFALQITDYKAWAQGLKDAGYATNPKYPSLLIGIIEELKLYEYDRVGASSKTDIQLGTSTPKEDKVSSTTAENSTTKAPSKKEKVSDKVKEKVEDVKNTLRIQSPFKKSDRTIKTQANKVKYIVAKKGDTFYKISKEFELTLAQLYRYNDFPKGKDLLMEGDIVYLQPKRNSGKKLKNITLTKEMSAKDISQAYGVKASEIVRKNQLESEDFVLAKGKKVQL